MWPPLALCYLLLSPFCQSWHFYFWFICHTLSTQMKRGSCLEQPYSYTKNAFAVPYPPLLYIIESLLTVHLLFSSLSLTNLKPEKIIIILPVRKSLEKHHHPQTMCYQQFKCSQQLQCVKWQDTHHMVSASLFKRLHVHIIHSSPTQVTTTRGNAIDFWVRTDRLALTVVYFWGSWALRNRAISTTDSNILTKQPQKRQKRKNYF